MPRTGDPKTRKRAVSRRIDARRARPETLAAEIHLDLEAANDYVEKHGFFADLAREFRRLRR